MADARSAKELKVFGAERFVADRVLHEITLMNEQEAVVDGRLLRRQSVLGAIEMSATVVAIVVAASLALHGRLSPGGLSLFLGAAVGVQNGAFAVAAGFGWVRASVLVFRALRQVLSQAPDVPEGTIAAPALSRAIEFRDVWFRYRDDLPWVLRGVNLTIAAGGSTGIIGTNGAGKSTLIKLLCRLYEPHQGCILWDGVDIRTLDLDSLRSRISAVFQDFVPYDLTAAENIAIGDAAAGSDDERITAAATKAEAHEFLARLPNGYGTLLSRHLPPDGTEKTAFLSGGQWQRVALARAYLRDRADLLILDEPASGLDAEAEQALLDKMADMSTMRTTVQISHRMSTQRWADQIYVLADGVVVERGAHEELMAADGVYAALFRMQFDGYVSRRR
ncbi:ABC transporter ATP-binding protein [Catenulispora yoronensis]